MNGIIRVIKNFFPSLQKKHSSFKIRITVRYYLFIKLENRFPEFEIIDLHHFSSIILIYYVNNTLICFQSL